MKKYSIRAFANKRSQRGVMPEAGIFFLNDISIPQRGETALIFSPHPDDETIATGGLIQKALSAGANIWVVLITNGNKHGLKQTRYREFKKAMAILSIREDRLVFLGYPDGKLAKQDAGQLKTEFSAIVAEKDPSVIFAPHTRDTHADHRVAGMIADEVSVERSIPLYSYLVHYPNFPKPKKYAPDIHLLPPLKLINFDHEWQRCTLDAGMESAKYKALMQYRTQLRNPFLRSTLRGFLRRNELFAVPSRVQKYG